MLSLLFSIERLELHFTFYCDVPLVRLYVQCAAYYKYTLPPTDRKKVGAARPDWPKAGPDEMFFPAKSGYIICTYCMYVHSHQTLSCAHSVSTEYFGEPRTKKWRGEERSWSHVAIMIIQWNEMEFKTWQLPLHPITTCRRMIFSSRYNLQLDESPAHSNPEGLLLTVCFLRCNEIRLRSFVCFMSGIKWIESGDQNKNIL